MNEVVTHSPSGYFVSSKISETSGLINEVVTHSPSGYFVSCRCLAAARMNQSGLASSLAARLVSSDLFFHLSLVKCSTD